MEPVYKTDYFHTKTMLIWQMRQRTTAVISNTFPACEASTYLTIKPAQYIVIVVLQVIATHVIIQLKFNFFDRKVSMLYNNRLPI